MSAATEVLLRRDSILIVWELRALWMTTALYVMACLFYLMWLLVPSSGSGKRAARMFFGGLIVHTGVLALRSVSAGRLPLQSPYEGLLVFGWSVAAVYVVVERRFRGILVAGFPASLLAGAACLCAVIGSDPGGLALHNWMFMLHAAAVSMSCGIFVVAFSVELGYLLVARVLPPSMLHRYGMDADTTARFHRTVHQLVLAGFPVLGMGIVFGLLWTHRVWGEYWLWGHGETWSLITWLVYALYVHSMTMARWRGGRASALNALGFVCVLMTVFTADRLANVAGIAESLLHR
jgi:ABC-type transport system involved in cytochrome c biogenesis permease subunit